VQEASGTTRLHSNCDPMTSHWSLIDESEEDEGSADEGEVAELYASGTESGEGEVAELNASDTESEFGGSGPEEEDKSRPWPCKFCPHDEMIAYSVLTNVNLLCCQLIRHSMSPELGVVTLGVKVIMLCLLAIEICTHLLTTVSIEYWTLALQACPQK
jgi:hypothetical protein